VAELIAEDRQPGFVLEYDSNLHVISIMVSEITRGFVFKVLCVGGSKRRG
jgi:hypothetical protein